MNQIEEIGLKVSRPCDLITNSIAIQKTMADRSTMQLLANETQETIETKAQILKSHAWCAIGVFELIDEQVLEPAKWFHAVERVKNNAVIIIGGQGDLKNVDVKEMGQKITFLELLPTSKVECFFFQYLNIASQDEFIVTIT